MGTDDEIDVQASRLEVERPDYRRVFGSAPARLLVLDTDATFTIVDATDAYLAATRTRRADIVGRGLFDVFAAVSDARGASMADVRASLERVVAGRCPDSVVVQELRTLTADSAAGGGFDQRCWSLVSSPVLGDDGAVRWIVQRLEDTDVHSREEHLRAVVETTPECVKLIASDGTVLEMNRSGLAMIGALRSDEVVGACVYGLVAPEHRDAYREFNARVCNGEKGTLEFDMIGPSGVRRHLETHAAPLRLADGRTVQLALTRDITQRRVAEEALRESDRRKDEFIATLSHELRNPLAPLRNALQLLRMQAPAGGPTASVQQMMERQINHLVRLVDDLLETSRISRGVLELRRERVELAAIVRNAIETSEPLIRDAGHELAVQLPGQPVWLEGDPVRLAQVFANLLSNAARFTERGGRIAIAADVEDGHARVSVRDTGKGFAPDDAKRLFEMFTKGDRSSGLGIGLALARRLAEMHGGTIDGSSQGEGRGAEFIVRLPLAAAEAETPSLVGEVGETRATPRCRVLVADDNRDAADSLAELLRELGSDVAVAYDGEEAVAIARRFHPDVALLDIGMPRLDGYGAARRIRAEVGSHPIRLVAVTGWGQDQDRQRAREAGFDEHLVKPPDLCTLQAVLASASRDRASRTAGR